MKGGLGQIDDLVLLDGDIFEIDPAQIDKMKVTLTMVDERIIFESK